ncbi:hypothetical protein [Glycocaulis albus]|uniref:hypothetical protein n=1 Tax=Glycocaulis albus TaxID=1382801 RepID=UPI00166DEF8C|nr:hypothetical protein [Glycocaulis albus]
MLEKIKSALLVIALSLVLVSVLSFALWFHYLRPMQSRAESRQNLDEFVEWVERQGGSSVVVSRGVEIFNPLSWGSAPCAVDAMIPIQGEFFGYVRYRSCGETVSFGYSLPSCDDQTWQHFSDQTWAALRNELGQLDLFGRPLPVAFRDVDPIIARSVIENVEASAMMVHESRLLCQ